MLSSGGGNRSLFSPCYNFITAFSRGGMPILCKILLISLIYVFIVLIKLNQKVIVPLIVLLVIFSASQVSFAETEKNNSYVKNQCKETTCFFLENEYYFCLIWGTYTQKIDSEAYKFVIIRKYTNGNLTIG